MTHLSQSPSFILLALYITQSNVYQDAGEAVRDERHQYKKLSKITQIFIYAYDGEHKERTQGCHFSE